MEGNQASRDKYFKFDVTISDLPDRYEDYLTIDWTNAVDAINAAKSFATIYSEEDIQTANGLDEAHDPNHCPRHYRLHCDEQET